MCESNKLWLQYFAQSTQNTVLLGHTAWLLRFEIYSICVWYSGIPHAKLTASSFGINRDLCVQTDNEMENSLYDMHSDSLKCCNLIHNYDWFAPVCVALVWFIWSVLHLSVLVVVVTYSSVIQYASVIHKHAQGVGGGSIAFPPSAAPPIACAFAFAASLLPFWALFVSRLLLLYSPSPPLFSLLPLPLLRARPRVHVMRCAALRCAVAASNVLLVSSMSRECLMSRKQGCRVPGLPGGWGCCLLHVQWWKWHSIHTHSV